MGHWYDESRLPRYFEGKNGNDTTLRDVRRLAKLGDILHASVTTYLGIKHKEGLVKWREAEAAEAAALKAIREGSSEADIDRIFSRQAIAEAKEKTTAKSDAGTVIHALLEKFHEDPFAVSGDDQKMCYAIVDCIHENTGLSLFDDFIPEETFCDTELGYAGMCDLHTKPEVEPWVLDYKSKDVVTDKTKGYPEQAEQVAAYAHGLGMPQARTGNIFISRTVPAEDEPWGVKFFENKDEMAWERFRHTLMLWQVSNTYGPYYDELVMVMYHDKIMAEMNNADGATE